MDNQQQIQNLLLKQYPDAVRSGVIQAYTAMFSDQVTYIPDGGPSCHSKADIEAFGKHMQSMFQIDPELEIKEMKINDAGNEAIVTGISHAKLTPRDGSADTSLVHFRALWVLGKESDGWKINKQIWNTQPEG